MKHTIFNNSCTRDEVISLCIHAIRDLEGTEVAIGDEFHLYWHGAYSYFHVFVAMVAVEVVEEWDWHDDVGMRKAVTIEPMRCYFVLPPRLNKIQTITFRDPIEHWLKTSKGRVREERSAANSVKLSGLEEPIN